MKPTILHISNDYPDPFKPDKTKAISNLVAATPEFRHVVYSLNRVNGLSGHTSMSFGEDKVAVQYRALPKGFFWKNRMQTIARWILADLKAKNIQPDLVQAHKITVEGTAGLEVANSLNRPLICDIQGGTDFRVLSIKRNLHEHFREIAERCVRIIPYAPWVIAPFEKAIGLKQEQCTCLPVLPGFDDLLPSSSRGSNKLITMMRFSDRANKNLTGLIAAISKLKDKYPDVTLDIYGRDDEPGLAELKHELETSGLGRHIIFKGLVANDALPQLLGSYAGLVMPSFTETYGLVYAEALFCGVPVLYSEDRAIAGYFDPQKIGATCNPADVDDIAKGIDHILTNEDALKRNINAMQQSGELDIIRRPAIIASYRNILQTALKAS